MTDIRIALLDMNNNHINQGFKNILEISEAFRQQSGEHVSIETFDVRHKNEMPDAAAFDIFISSGGPGDPHREGLEWEDRFAGLLDSIFNHNRTHSEKKYLFLICHSFQLAAIHWRAGQYLQKKILFFWHHARAQDRGR
ncbi:UNVERIFIED_CONTAM: GMP synthase-like glutamine amidotransferase [Pseudacidovorax intermedius]|nr:GMP synthase-like glutamine amidotransferase [Pseudacidovorax intermedius]